MTSTCAFIVMIVTAYASAGVIPVPDENASSDLSKGIVPLLQPKTLAALIAELKGLEIWRQSELKKALEDPELVKDPDTVKYLQSLVEYDKRWFVYAVRILDSLETLDHPDDKTPEEIQQASHAVLDFKHNLGTIQREISGIKATVDVASDQVPDEIFETHQMEVVTTAFRLSCVKLLEAFNVLEAQRSQNKSIYSKNYVEGCKPIGTLHSIGNLLNLAVPAVVSPEPAVKSVDKLLNDLKVIERDRKAQLKKALRKPKFMADPNTMEKLAVFSMVDSLFIEYHNYYNAMNTLVHSYEKSTDSHEVLATIRSSRECLIQLYKAITAKQEKLHRPSKGPDNHMHLFTAIFKDTLRKNVEIEAQLRVEFGNSPLIKQLKNIPNVSPI